MRKIKIITFVNENNYGALLQSFALQEACKQLGFSVSFIDYNFARPKGSFRDRVLYWISNPIQFLYKIKLLSPPDNRVSFSSFVDFRNKYLVIEGKKYSSINDLTIAPPAADVYITGSDQVWSPRIVSKEHLRSFFLCFGQTGVRRISYAASFGGQSFSSATVEYINNHLIGFDFCSIREHDLSKNLKRIGVETYDLVPDPTLLIDWSHRKEISFALERTKQIGLFILNPKHRDVFFNAIQYLGSKVVPFEINEGVESKSTDPFSWISNLSKCHFFVTDSYHAVIFSIVTKTSFAVLLHVGHDEERNVRILELLSRLGLESRSVSSLTGQSLISLQNSVIDWDLVHTKLIEFRRIGIDFLKLI